jgi:hypothetical protein
MLIMGSKNERVELAIKIMRYRELSQRTADEELLRAIKDKIAELEQKLREIDE